MSASMSLSKPIWALIAYGTDGRWTLEPVVPRKLRDDEALIRLVATGICLADLHASTSESGGLSDATAFPRVLGHEGSGHVEAVGCKVSTVKPLDPVIMSFAHCGVCDNCLEEHPAYCTHFFDLNFGGERGVYAASSRDDTMSLQFDIGGSFFGQSSFASKAIVKERCLVNLAGKNITRKDLQTLAPLACGVQTGTGAFINIADVQCYHEVAVLGVGGVGQSAVMAAAMRRCKTIIAIDKDVARLNLAKSLGATHTINTSAENVELVEEVKRITSGQGVHMSLDTTGNRTLAMLSWNFVRNRGKVLQVGLARPHDTWEVSMADHMNSGKQIIGCVEGDAVPQKYILDMVDWFQQGQLPMEKMVRFYAVEQYEDAIRDMRLGVAVKPVLLWPETG